MTLSRPFPVREGGSSEAAPRSAGRWLLLNLLVLIAYSVLGVIILFFGIGPAKISPIYPPAGIAVAAVIVLGPRILPAVFIGEFLNGFPLLFLPDTTVRMYVLANIGVGIGAALEAWIGARLLEHCKTEFDIPGRLFDLIIANEVIADFPVVSVRRETGNEHDTTNGPTASRFGQNWQGEGVYYLDKYELFDRNAPDSFFINAGAMRFIERAWKHLRPGGTLILSEYGWEHRQCWGLPHSYGFSGGFSMKLARLQHPFDGETRA